MTDHEPRKAVAGVDPQRTTVHEALGEVRKRLDPAREGPRR